MQWTGFVKMAGRLVLSSGLDLWLAAMFLITWFRPNTFGELSVHHLLFVMLLEFLVVHSTGFLGAVGARDVPRRERLLMYSALLVFYTLFAAGFSVMYGGWWPLLAFLGLTLSKFPTVVLRPPSLRGQSVIIANWAAMTCLYLGGVFVTVVPPVPAFGITPEVIAAQNLGAEGVWPEEPYRVMAFGAFYFTGLALLACINEIIAIASARKHWEVEKRRAEVR